MSKRSEMWDKVHELSCSHAHIRADECPICRKEFELIINESCKDDTSEGRVEE